MTPVLTTLQVRREAGKQSKSYWPRCKSMPFSCSSPWRPIAWPAAHPCFSLVLHLPALALQTLPHAPALCPHISCPSLPHLGQSSRGNDMDRFRVAVKLAGIIQWDLTTKSPFSSPDEPPQSSSMGSLHHWRACQTQPLLQHNIPLPKENHFPHNYSLIYSWLDTTPTSSVNATHTAHGLQLQRQTPGDAEWLMCHIQPATSWESSHLKG